VAFFGPVLRATLSIRETFTSTEVSELKTSAKLSYGVILTLFKSIREIC
jgi:hypothetical protein